MDRKRSANFTLREKEILVSLVEKYIKIIENKKTNSIYNKQKAECWEKLAGEFNSTQTSGLRTGVQLKTTYEKMKQLAKQHKSEDKVEIVRTGGGNFVTKISDLDERILMLLKTNYFCIDNKFDSNVKINTSPLTETKISEVEVYSKIEVNDVTRKYLNNSFVEDSEKITVIYEQDEDNRKRTNSDIIQLPLIHTEHDQMSNTSGNTIHSHYQIPQKIENMEFQAPVVDKVFKKPELHTPDRGQGKKRKFKPLPTPHDIIRKPLINKKMELLEKKSCILDVIKEVEIENLKSKKLDNEIKEIAREREKLELEIKRLEYKNLLAK